MGAWYTPLIACVFHLLDFISGFIGAVKEKNIKSSKMRDGLFKKFGYIACYILAYLIDTYGCLIGLSVGVDVLPIIVLYAVSTEIVSIIENICRINSDLLPDKLKKIFHINSTKEED